MRGNSCTVAGIDLDAASGALVGHLFLQEKAEVYGDFKSGAIIMPPQS